MTASLGDEAGALGALRAAQARGLWDPLYFEDPALAGLQANPEFLGLRAETRQLLEREHAEALQLICFDNPVPDTWEPLESTCVGVSPRT